MGTVMMPSGAWSAVSAVVLGVLLLLAFKYLLTSSKYKNLPPGPRGLLIIGSLHLLGKFPQPDFTKLAESYGPLMSIWLGSRLAVVATSPAAAKEILKTQGSDFANRIPTSFSDVIVPEGRNPPWVHWGNLPGYLQSGKRRLIQSCSSSRSLSRSFDPGCQVMETAHKVSMHDYYHRTDASVLKRPISERSNKSRLCTDACNSATDLASLRSLLISRLLGSRWDQVEQAAMTWEAPL